MSTHNLIKSLSNRYHSMLDYGIVRDTLILVELTYHSTIERVKIMTRSKQDKADFIANLRAGVEALKDQGVTPPSNLLDSFSPNNALMIILQKPSATQCAGFHAWREAGRSVKKGSRGAAILVPIGADDDGDLRFTWRYVFDIADTEELVDSSPRLARELAVA